MIFPEQSSCERRKERTGCKNMHLGEISYFILLSELVLLLLPEIGCTARKCQTRPSAMTFSPIDFHTIHSTCQRSPHVELNVSLASPWLGSPAGVCSDLSWRTVLQLDMINATTNCSVTLKCSDVHHVSNKLSEIAVAFDAFCSAVRSFDCSQKYSVRKNCSNCLVAYRLWLCLVKLFTAEVKPCLDVCYEVYRSCPSFQPEESYGGYHVFECPKEQGGSYGPQSNCISAASLPKGKG